MAMRALEHAGRTAASASLFAAANLYDTSLGQEEREKKGAGGKERNSGS
jgi:hypothetical protein